MQFLRSIPLLAVLLSAAVNAFPTASLESISDLSKLSKRSLDGHQITGCDLSGAILPKVDGPTLLADPDPGLTLTRVVLGRGTQNYTCKDSLATTVPAAAGAKAILYDASCLAAYYPSLLHELPDVLVTVSEKIEYFAGAVFQRIAQEDVVVGHHYFAPDFSTPVFDFRLKAAQNGIFTGVRDQAVPAALFSALGGSPDEQFGAIDWLRLKAVPGKTVDYKLAYRVHTAGGKAPPTCTGRPAEFTINYSAEYWFYN